MCHCNLESVITFHIKTCKVKIKAGEKWLDASRPSPPPASCLHHPAGRSTEGRGYGSRSRGSRSHFLGLLFVSVPLRAVSCCFTSSSSSPPCRAPCVPPRALTRDALPPTCAGGSLLALRAHVSPDHPSRPPLPVFSVSPSALQPSPRFPRLLALWSPQQDTQASQKSAEGPGGRVPAHTDARLSVL